jgi:hypothetical protein
MKSGDGQKRFMKKILYAVAMVASVGLCARADEATMATTNAPASDINDYVGKLGVGIILGDPTGASLKYWLNDTMAVDGAIGWSPRDHTDLYLHGDILWHDFDLIPVSQGRLPLYFGVGGLVRVRDDNDDNQIGVRAPVGLSYMFDNIPVDVFVEVAPAIDLAPDVRGEVTGDIGVRYWFF